MGIEPSMTAARLSNIYDSVWNGQNDQDVYPAVPLVMACCNAANACGYSLGPRRGRRTAKWAGRGRICRPTRRPPWRRRRLTWAPPTERQSPRRGTGSSSRYGFPITSPTPTGVTGATAVLNIGTVVTPYVKSLTYCSIVPKAHVPSMIMAAFCSPK